MTTAHNVLVAPVRHPETPAPNGGADTNDLEHRPEVVLSVLEADQLVVSKEHARFGQRPLSGRVRLLLGGLRLYVIFMMALVAIQVLRATQGGH